MYLFNPLNQFNIIAINYFNVFDNLISFFFHSIGLKLDFYQFLIRWPHYSNLIENLNNSFFLLIFLFFISIFFSKIIPNINIQYIFELLIKFVENIVLSNASLKNQKWIPIFFILFLILIIFNVTGIIPYNFTASSHMLITLFLSFTFFFAINFLGIKKHKLGFLALFLPSGIPFLLKPLLIFIELISYNTRVISLATRLFANMMAGHTLLKILSSFLFKIFKLGSVFILFDFLPISILLILIAMESGIALLQVYVFILLSTIYLKDANEIKH